MKTLVPSHPKTRMLADALGVRIPEAVGILAMLWNYGKQSAKDGDLTSLSADRLALLLGWPMADGARLYEALAVTGWVDPHPHTEGAYVIHGWLEHCEGYVIRDLVSSGRLAHHSERGIDPVEFYRSARRSTTQHGAARRSTAQHDMLCSPPPSPPPSPSSKPIPPSPADAGSGEEAAGFDEWWASYPLRRPGAARGNKGKAWRLWVKLSEADRARVVQATKRLIDSGQMPKDADRFLRPSSGGGHPPWRDWLEDTSGAPVASGGKSETVTERKEKLNVPYNASWLTEPEPVGPASRRGSDPAA